VSLKDDHFANFLVIFQDSGILWERKSPSFLWDGTFCATFSINF